MWNITAPTAQQQYDYQSYGIYFSGESGLREAARVGVSAAVGARMGAVVGPIRRARPRSSNSAPAGNPKNRFFDEALRDDQEYGGWATSLEDIGPGPVLWSVVVCTIEGRGGEASQHVQKNIQGGGTKLM